MHPIAHVAVSLLIGLGLALHTSRKYIIVVASALFVNGFIDSDVFLIEWGFVNTRIFQTGVVMLYLPFFLVLAAHLYEKGTGRSIYTRVSMLIFLIGTSHMLMDTIGEREPVYLYYPFSLSKYSFNDQLIPFVIIFFGIIVVLGSIVETYMYVTNEEKRTVEGWGFKEVLDDYRGKMVDMKEGFLRRIKRE